MTATTATLDQRVLDATTGALELFGIYLGTRLGLYATLHERPGCTMAELADRAGIAPRYAQEWLEQQAVAGVLDVLSAGLGSDAPLVEAVVAQARAIQS